MKNSTFNPLLRLAALFLLLTFWWSGCSTPHKEIPGHTPRPALNYECNLGEQYEFEISMDPITGSADYVCYFNTGPFTLDYCMVKIIDVQLAFTGINPDDPIEVKSLSGTPLGVTLLSDDNGITIYDIDGWADLPDPNLTFLVDFPGAPDNYPVPERLFAGGLCVVENVDGQDPHSPLPISLNGPLVVGRGGKGGNPGGPTHPGPPKVYLPLSYVLNP